MKLSYIHNLIKDIWLKSAPISSLKTLGSLKRYNQKFYIDCIPSAASIGSNALSLTSDISASSLETKMIALSASIAQVKDSQPISLIELNQTLLRYETKLAALRIRADSL